MQATAPTAPRPNADMTPPAADGVPSEMRHGVPTLAEVEALLEGPFWRANVEFNRAFLERHRAALAGYAFHWGVDPLKLWSRRWEYPFAGRAVLAHAQRRGRSDLTVCDAGSGVTFFPYLMSRRLPGLKVICCDTAGSYAPMFAAINRSEPDADVRFRTAALQGLPFEDGSLDILCCISVLEHTDDYERIVREVARVLRPGGRFVLTFDISMEHRFSMQPLEARRMFATLGELFDAEPSALMAEMERALAEPADRLCTPTIRQRQPELLPWRYPKLQAAYDLLRGHGWTGGFRSVMCYCLDVPRRG